MFGLYAPFLKIKFNVTRTINLKKKQLNHAKIEIELLILIMSQSFQMNLSLDNN